MIRFLLKNKTGVTLLEGLIALGLLAMVAAGSFGVLLSVSRKSSHPDIREEMLLAIERANEGLQLYAAESTASSLPAEYEQGLCGGDSQPLQAGSHNINCMLPDLCDWSTSSFSYQISSSGRDVADLVTHFNAQDPALRATNVSTATFQVKDVHFSITCNGFTL